MKWRRFSKGILIILLFGVIVFTGVGGWLFIKLWKMGPEDVRLYLKVDSSKCLLGRDGKRLWVGLNKSQQWCIPITIDEVSPYIVSATVAVEDKRFWNHIGVDFWAICRALAQNIVHRKVISGGSTITMQVVKVYHKDSKDWNVDSTLGRFLFKIFQMVQAIRLETYATKEEVLEAYLNKVSYGSNLVGVMSGSWKYFGKDARHLNLEESAILAGIPKLPEFYRPDRNYLGAIARAKYVLGRMRENNFISDGDYVSAVSKLENVSLKIHTFPCHAFHLAQRVFKSRREDIFVKTTLDSEIQIGCEEIIRKKLKQLEGEVNNGCVIVVDVETGEILAYVGGVVGINGKPVSYIDYCQVKNSPGSALKPFLYCYAIEKGFLYPSEILFDSEFDVGTYNPKNFDEMFHGMVDVRTALRYSLNIPAVNVLQRVGVKNFVNRLEKSGIKVENSVDASNLGVVLGGCEVSLWEMMMGYLCIAREGKAIQMKVFPEENSNEWVVFDRGAVDILYQLMESRLEDESAGYQIRFDREPIRVCWKTGTSSNRCDAWVFMFNKHYLVGVWFGNTNRRSSPKLIGALLSYPVASEVFKRLPRKKGEEFPQFPNDALKEIEVCSISGLLATPLCESVKKVYVPENMPLARRCDVHYLDLITGEVKKRFPSKSDGWDLSRVGVADENKKVVEKFKILFPSNGTKFIISKLNQNNKLEFRSSGDLTQGVFWYVDDEYIGKENMDCSVQWELVPGKHKILCVDAKGNKDVVFIEVEKFEEN